MQLYVKANLVAGYTKDKVINKYLK